MKRDGDVAQGQQASKQTFNGIDPSKQEAMLLMATSFNRYRPSPVNWQEQLVPDPFSTNVELDENVSAHPIG